MKQFNFGTVRTDQNAGHVNGSLASSSATRAAVLKDDGTEIIAGSTGLEIGFAVVSVLTAGDEIALMYDDDGVGTNEKICHTFPMLTANYPMTILLYTVIPATKHVTAKNLSGARAFTISFVGITPTAAMT
jgi:hypothetical protein